MTNTKFGILCALGFLGVVSLVALVYHGQVHLREENEALRQKAEEMPRLSGENRRLSNVVVQASIAKALADERLQEFLTAQAELKQLRQENQKLTRAHQALIDQGASEQLRELASLRSEISGLGEELSQLRDDIQQVVTESPSSNAEPVAADSVVPVQDQPIAIRIVRVQGDTFPEKLRRTVAAGEEVSIQDALAQFLETGGVNLRDVAGLVFDARRGRLVVRASETTLDLIEKLTTGLDREK